MEPSQHLHNNLPEDHGNSKQSGKKIFKMQQSYVPLDLKKGPEPPSNQPKLCLAQEEKGNKGMFSGELPVDDGDNLAREFSECSNQLYICMHLKKGLEPPTNQPKHLPGKMKEYIEKEKKRNVSNELLVMMSCQSTIKIWQEIFHTQS